MTNFIVNGDGLERLEFFLRFLLAWKKRPTRLTAMAYKWCSDFFEPAGSGAPFQTQRQDTVTGRIAHEFLPPGFDPPENVLEAFTCVGPLCDLIRSGDASHHTRECPREWVNFERRQRPLLFMILEVGFRLGVPMFFRLDHTPHRNLVFKHAFSSGDDEVIADAVCASIADGDRMLVDSCVHYLAERVAQDPPLSPRVRKMGITLIEHMWNRLEAPGPEIIPLLNHLSVGAEDMGDKDLWALCLVDVICSPVGSGGLSIHYWHLMEELPHSNFPIAHAMELARSLEEAEDWEKLEAWMVVAWRTYWEGLEEPTRLESLERLKQVTLKHLRRRPSALPRFEAVPRWKGPRPHHYPALEDICTQVRAKRLPLELPSP